MTDWQALIATRPTDWDIQMTWLKCTQNINGIIDVSQVVIGKKILCLLHYIRKLFIYAIRL